MSERHPKDVRHFYGTYGEIGENLIYNVPAIGVNSPSVDRTAHNSKWMRRRFGGTFDAAPFTADAYFDPDVLPLLTGTAPGAQAWATTVGDTHLVAAYTSLSLSAQPLDVQPGQPVRVSMGFTPSDPDRDYSVPIALQALPMATLSLDSTQNSAQEYALVDFGTSTGQDGILFIVVITSTSGTYTVQPVRSATSNGTRNNEGSTISPTSGVKAIERSVDSSDAARYWGLTITRTSSNNADNLQGWIWGTRLAGARELV